MFCSGGAIVYLIDCSFGLSFASKYDREGSTLRHSIDSACYGRHSTRGTSRALTKPGAFLQLFLCRTLCRFSLDSEIVVVVSTPAIWGSSYGSEQLFSCRRFQKTFMWNSRKEYDQ